VQESEREKKLSRDSIKEMLILSRCSDPSPTTKTGREKESEANEEFHSRVSPPTTQMRVKGMMGMGEGESSEGRKELFFMKTSPLQEKRQERDVVMGAAGNSKKNFSIATRDDNESSEVKPVWWREERNTISELASRGRRATFTNSTPSFTSNPPSTATLPSIRSVATT
jgi:hypothetical protein